METSPRQCYLGRSVASNDPGPKGVVMLVQVPLGTSFHEFP